MSDPLLPIPWLDVLIIIGLIVLNGVFAMSELAIVSSREARLRAMAKSGSGGAKCALDLAAEPGRFLSTVQIGITLIGVLAGAFSGASLGEPMSQRMMLLGLEKDTAETVGLSCSLRSAQMLTGCPRYWVASGTPMAKVARVESPLAAPPLTFTA